MRRVKVRHRSLRALLSEFLPYELPAGLSNRLLYRYLVSIGARLDEKGLRFRDSPESAALLKLILGPAAPTSPLIDGGKRYLRVPMGVLIKKTVPYRFRIAHGQDGFRELAIPHIAGQLALSHFYEAYGDLITYYGNRSAYSVRRPVAVSRVTVVRDDIFEKNKEPSTQNVETTSTEIDLVRSFFVYDKHAGINALFDSREFLEAEQSFSQMMRLDISKCFESIYTHSIEWSVYGRAVVKSRKSAFGGTMPREFDRLMMAVKEEETNGILIGPEVSRIFAEIVLQGVDQEVERDLHASNAVQGRDYQLFRYVDDFYFFYNSAEVSLEFRKVVDARLHEFGLHLNESKTIQVRTPHLTSLSVAKARVREASAKLRLMISRAKDQDASLVLDIPGGAQLSSLVSSYKMALAETGVGPEDLANYVLVLVEEQMEAGLAQVLNVEPGSVSPGELSQIHDRVCSYLSLVLEYSFFVFAGSGRASAAVKIARISSLALRAVEEVGMPNDRAEHVKQVIFEEARRVMGRHPLRQNATLESLYLLDVVSSLGASYRLTLDELIRFAGAMRSEGQIVLPSWMHSIAAMTLLRNVGQIQDLGEFSEAIVSWARSRLEWMLAQETDSAERAILALDMLASPYVPRATKIEVLDGHKIKFFGVDKAEAASANGWFTNWKISDLHSELMLKRSQHVY